MNNEIKVSVIVPVYNSEKHLEQCLESICSQTLRDIEILCVDDGSTDRSPEILERFHRRDPRIRTFRQENLYAGVARNVGKAHASGQYLVFWDSDDYFYETALEKMYLQCEADDADICVCDGNTFLEGHQKEVPSGVYLIPSRIPEELPFNRHTNPDHICDFTVVAPWNKMYRRAFIERLSLDFKPIRNGNDAFFVVCAGCLADRVTVVKEPLVCYRTVQSGGLTATLSEAADAPIQTWIDAANYLRSKEAFPERSFANRALSSMLTFLRKLLTSEEAFRSIVDRLKNGALAQMGVVEREDGYYYEAWKADCLHCLLHHSAEEFLAYFLYVSYNRLTYASGQNRILSGTLASVRKDLAAARSKNARLREKTEELRDQRQELRDQCQTLRGQCQTLRDQRQELRDQRQELQAQCQKLQDRLEKNRKKLDRTQKRCRRLEKNYNGLKNSLAYRIGRAILWLPDRIRSVFR